MTNLNATIVGSDGESHPIAREVHRQITEAVDRSGEFSSLVRRR